MRLELFSDDSSRGLRVRIFPRFRKARPKNQLAILRGTSRILEIRELTFVKQLQSSNSSMRIQSDSPQTHIGTLLASERRQKSTVK